jgi:hypothetical protein
VKREKGLKSKTWLSGINTHSIGGFYEFDSLENAQTYATGYLASSAQQLGGSLSVRLFDGDVVAEASRGIIIPLQFRMAHGPALRCAVAAEAAQLCVRWL